MENNEMKNYYVLDLNVNIKYTGEVYANDIEEAKKILLKEYENNNLISINEKIMSIDTIKESNYFIWKYIFVDKEDYLSFLSQWKRMYDEGYIYEIPKIKEGTITELKVYSIVDLITGYYEQWTECDGEEQEHLIINKRDLDSHKILHPNCDMFFCYGVWNNAIGEEKMKHKYFFD